MVSVELIDVSVLCLVFCYSFNKKDISAVDKMNESAAYEMNNFGIKTNNFTREYENLNSSIAAEEGFCFN